jgi:hypothetical protein
MDVSSAVFPGSDEGLYGIWRNQIGRPRDEVTVMSCWSHRSDEQSSLDRWFDANEAITGCETWWMHPTLRPATTAPPERQGNYAFRWFETPVGHWSEFLELCESAWPNFEASYDSQVIGLWRLEAQDETTVSSLLLTRRPSLAMWERSKIPEGEVEAEVRRKLSRRYDLCTDTLVYTTTLLSASDEGDTTRWT